MKSFIPKMAGVVLFFQLNLWLCQSGLAVGFLVTPSVVSNTYVGPVTLEVTGLTNGETVVVQEFLDFDGNGVVDAGDALAGQFDLTDGQPGMVIGGVTNLNVPGDNDGAANGQITAQLNFPGGDFVQTVAGKHLFELSSPFGRFAPVTDLFTVTNFAYGQKFTGSVVNSGTNVPGAAVILFTPPRPGDHGPGNPVAGAVADNSGNYTVAAPVGTYLPVAFASNFVASLNSSPLLSLASSQTLSTNLTLTNATETISGRIADINTMAGIPGIFSGNGSQSHFIALGFSDTNGNFADRVVPDIWSLDGEPDGLAFHGYVGYNGKTNVDATGGNVSGVNLLLPKGTALFYGTVEDSQNHPIPNVDISTYDGSNTYSADSFSDSFGDYALVALGNTNETWQVQVSTDKSATNYIFSQPFFDAYGGSYLTNGEATNINFVALPVGGVISGNVSFEGTNVVGVGVNANDFINGQEYSLYVDTDSNGNYSLNVANDTGWYVSVNCNGGNDSLDNILGMGNYLCPMSQSAPVSSNTVVVNFVIQNCSGIQILTTNLPDATQTEFYYAGLDAATCATNVTWSLNDPQDFPSGLNLSSDGIISGFPNTNGTFNFTVHALDSNGHSTNQALSLFINPPPPVQVETTSLPDATNGVSYNQFLYASGGFSPYTWTIPAYSAPLPANLTLRTDGTLSGTPATNGLFYFDVQVEDSQSNIASKTLSLRIINPSLPPLVITNNSLPNGRTNVSYSAQLGATGGQPPYSWQLALGSARLPPGLALNTSGLISGTPTANGTSSFQVQVTDADSSTAQEIFSITVSSVVLPPTIMGAGYLSGNRFQMTVDGSAGQNYTVQVTTNLSSTNWFPAFTTNPVQNSFLFTDPYATDPARFYRVQAGP